MMIAAFAAGLGAGIIASIVAGIAVLRLPPPKRSVPPKYFAVVGDGPCWILTPPRTVLRRMIGAVRSGIHQRAWG
jgi:hypothetical protein